VLTIEWRGLGHVETVGRGVCWIVETESDMVCIYRRQYDGPVRVFVAIKTKNLVKKDRSQRPLEVDMRVPVVVGIEVALIPRKAKCSWEVGVFCSVG
jgi:hypothetical protein